ncbi:MAG: hypothetical protein B7X29_11335, partial [Halothiobacillus sp. 13-55-115]
AAPIKVGGAVRFNYTLEQFNQNSRNTVGDLNFDTFRLNLDGQIDNVILSAEWRYYDYMQVIHHAWVGYKFTPNWLVRAGVVKVPFGNLPFLMPLSSKIPSPTDLVLQVTVKMLWVSITGLIQVTRTTNAPMPSPSIPWSGARNTPGKPTMI